MNVTIDKPFVVEFCEEDKKKLEGILQGIEKLSGQLKELVSGVYEKSDKSEGSEKSSSTEPVKHDQICLMEFCKKMLDEKCGDDKGKRKNLTAEMKALAGYVSDGCKNKPSELEAEEVNKFIDEFKKIEEVNGGFELKPF